MKKRAFKIEISAEAENYFDSSYSFYYDDTVRRLVRIIGYETYDDFESSHDYGK